jgi:hypothetical protein
LALFNTDTPLGKAEARVASARSAEVVFMMSEVGNYEKARIGEIEEYRKL